LLGEGDALCGVVIRQELPTFNDEPSASTVITAALPYRWMIESAPQAQERKVRDELTDRAQAA